jgi:RHS repeat-associated protein
MATMTQQEEQQEAQTRTGQGAQMGLAKQRGMLAALVLAAIGTAQAGTVTRTTDYSYDATTGAVTRQTVEPASTQVQVQAAYTYDRFGNRLTTTVSSPATGTAAIPTRSNSTSYDANGIFPTGSVNALGQTTGRTYADTHGRKLTHTDANGSIITWNRDEAGRKVKTVKPDGNFIQHSYNYCGLYAGINTPCLALAKYVVTATPTASDGTTQNGPWSKTYYDAYDRVVRSETQGFDGTAIIRVDTEYDSQGRVARTSRPYYSSQTPKWTVMSYDALGRLVATTAPDGSQTTTAYSGYTTTVTNALGQRRTTVRNSQGQVVQTIDEQNHSLTYQYDAQGNLLQTTDPQGNVMRMEYDLLGRRTKQVDPDLGTWNYTYDALGELVQQTDAKGQATTMAYDLLGRMTQRAEPDLVSTWTYDTTGALHGDTCRKGKVCTATTDNGYSRSQAYDSYGRPTTTTTTIDTSYVTTRTYDANGRVLTEKYPTGLTLKYVYTSLGYLKEVRNSANSALYWRADAKDAEGHLLQQTYGNNVVTQQVYDDATGRLTNIHAGAGDGVQNLTFGYDAIGNVLSRADANQNLSETFLYDELNRLTGNTVNAPGAGLATQNYAYDALGNITSRSDLGTYSYGATNAEPHAVQGIAYPDGGRRAYGYDANGNLTTETQYDASNNPVAGKGKAYTWTSFNMPKTISANGVTLSFTYGPDHQRVKQIAPSATTIYLHPDNAGGLAYEKDIKADGSVEHRMFVTAGNGVVAIVKQVGNATPVPVYLHRDHLGSTTAATDASGNVVERFAYEPFGRRRYPAGNTDPDGTIAGVTTNRGFTNHEELDAVDLVHMNGRVYDPTTGRFISADPTNLEIAAHPGDLQAYNRYAYVRNNPLNETDPSGFSDWEESLIPINCNDCGGYGYGNFELIRYEYQQGGFVDENGVNADVYTGTYSRNGTSADSEQADQQASNVGANLTGTDSVASWAAWFAATDYSRNSVQQNVALCQGGVQGACTAAANVNGANMSQSLTGFYKTTIGGAVELATGAEILEVLAEAKAAGQLVKVLGEKVFTTTAGRTGAIAENVVKNGTTLTFENFTIASTTRGHDLVGAMKQLLKFGADNGATTFRFQGIFSNPELAAKFGMQVGNTFDFTVSATRTAILNFLKGF